MRISLAESLVMEALWRRQPLTAEDIFAELGPGQGWAEATLKTLLSRLHKKGAVSTQKDGRRFHQAFVDLSFEIGQPNMYKPEEFDPSNLATICRHLAASIGLAPIEADTGTVA